MKILDVLEQRIEKVRKHLNKAKEKMDLNKGKEKMVMEIDTSYDHKPFQVTFAESSDHNPFQATSDKKSDHNPFQATSDKSSDHNLFQATSDESFDHKQKKATIPSEILQWYDDLSSDEQMTVYKGRPGSSSRNAAITKPKKPKSRSKHLAPTTHRTRSKHLVAITKPEIPKSRSKHLAPTTPRIGSKHLAAITKLEKPKSRSKHLAPTTPRIGSTCTTLVVPTKSPPQVTNCALGLAAVKTWQQILNKEFRIKKAKEDVGGSSDVRRKGKRKML
ncbi:hypothetical protein Tco_1541390 [Tanacetum coccineum]